MLGQVERKNQQGKSGSLKNAWADMDPSQIMRYSGSLRPSHRVLNGTQKASRKDGKGKTRPHHQYLIRSLMETLTIK
jgi:hypothetical protein